MCTLLICLFLPLMVALMASMFELLMLDLARRVNVADHNGLVVVCVDGHGLETVH